MNLSNLPDDVLYLHLMDEVTELRDRAAEFSHALGRPGNTNLTDALDGIRATLRRVEALRDELASRGVVKK